ncbi:M56 family metallopeptidase [Dyadobacter frigoris]|uniref:TonB family protein n=1 Tax=Dyadobacter frigoris TaxID=2576211 RepID=A0A4U6DCU6_9BACT|nr:M56 family metallopeptidase [Dyadobacter frigoris]TKT94108.1 TonB family protein [Dyadobacter frigoris]GLU50681.1 cell envelope biogenesis protein TonB [Dyadobacter frigoris]
MEILIYVAKVSLYWTLFYACYRLLLSKQTFFVWNRIYLISSLLVSFALPFIIYPESAPVISLTYSVTNPNFTVSSTPTEQIPIITWTQFIWSVYILGALFMAFKLFSNIRQLNHFLKDGELIEMEDCKIILIDSNRIGSFSFLKWIVVNRNDYENHFDPILRHEMVHMQQWHSVDILLVELLKIIFWFNPLLLLYKKSLQEVHEFLADYEAPNRENYATFLVSYALNAPIASLTNHFYKPSQIKTRIQMIYKNRSSKWLLSTYILAATVITSVAVFVAGCERKESHEPVGSEKNDGRKTELLKNQLDPSLIGKKIYSVVENQPEFPGGTTAMFEFLGDHIKYPASAIKANIEGRVFLTFVVSETGEISDIKVLKGIGFGCDEEAVRVLSQFPKWKPALQDGVPVNVKYNLPINFQLDDTKKTSSIDKQFKNPDGSISTLTTDGKVIEESPKNTKVNIQITGPKPLLVVDGKIAEDQDMLKNFDAKNILSVDVLKDQKAIEAYGEKGSHGVISVTTKKI